MKTALTIVAFGLLIATLIFFGARAGGQKTDPINNVRVADGQQIIEIQARGGYQPRLSSAKAGLPTILRFNTQGSFDCSASVRIPSLNITKLLPQTGSTDIDIGTSSPGQLLGTCGMGMYRFEVDFKS